jgi:hypothetical protein
MTFLNAEFWALSPSEDASKSIFTGLILSKFEFLIWHFYNCSALRLF